MSVPHTQSAEDVLKELASDPSVGLSSAEVVRRAAEFGPNALQGEKGRNPFRILVEQFSSVLVLILVAAAVVSLVLGEGKDAIAILAIILLNAALGFRQEYGAEQAMAALRKLSVPKVKVRRDGEVAEITGTELVPGDILLLEAGNLVPADARLVENASLRVQEAALTGESEPVEKGLEAVSDPSCPIGDRANVVHMGTIVTYGRGVAVVTATGSRTELGKVAGLIQSTPDDPSPLTVKIDHLGKVLKQ